MSVASSRNIDSAIDGVERQLKVELMGGPRSTGWSFTRRVLEAAESIVFQMVESERKYQKRYRQERSYSESFEIAGPNTRGDVVVGALRNTHPAARALEHGKGAYPISAREGGRLVYPSPGLIGSEAEDVYVFTRQVKNHPIGARHYIRRAMDVAVQEVESRRR